jgi:hypothetical protein
MFKSTVIGLTCFLLGLAGGIGAISHSQTLRLEIGAGVAKHQLAPEGSWWYEGFDTKTKLLTGSYEAGLAWFPIQRGDWLIGGRAGYFNTGTVKAQNSFPIFEDRTNRDARVNPVCDKQTYEGCTGKFSGQGKASGWYIGPAVEKSFGKDWSVGGEIGAFFYSSAWTADTLRVFDNDGTEFTPPGQEHYGWDNARERHVTPYAGLNARYQWVYVSTRVYGNVRAARTDVNPEFVGMTSGPVWSVMAGLSIPLN